MATLKKKGKKRKKKGAAKVVAPSPSPRRVIGSQSLRSVARRSGMSAPHLSYALSGKRGLSIDAYERLAKTLGMTIDELRKRMRRK